MDYSPCPVCGHPTLIVTALFTSVDWTCEDCRYTGSLAVTPALRSALHAVLDAGLARLRRDYGLAVPAERTARWYSAPNPLTGLTVLESWLHDIARESAGAALPAPLEIGAWQRARDDASAEIAVWLSTALYAAVQSTYHALAEVA